MIAPFPIQPSVAWMLFCLWSVCLPLFSQPRIPDPYDHILELIDAGELDSADAQLMALDPPTKDRQVAWHSFLQGHLRFSQTQRQYAEIGGYLNQAKTMAEKSTVQDPLLLGKIWYDLARYSFLYGQYQEAEERLNTSQGYKIRYLSLSDIEMGKCYDFRGLIHSNSGNLETANKWYQEAQKVYDQGSSSLHTYLQTDLINKQGNLLFRMNEYESAEEMYWEAKNGWERMDTLPRKLAAAYSGLGNVYDEWQEYELATYYHKEAIDICEGSFMCSQSKDYAKFLINWGVTLDHLQEQEEAFLMFRRALEILDLPLEHPSLETSLSILPKNKATLYLNIGSMHLAMGQDDLAYEFLLSALNIRKGIYPANHPRLAASYSALGRYHLQQQTYQEAKSHFLEAVKIHYSSKDSPPEMAENYLALARVYQQTTQWDSALYFVQNAVQVVSSDFWNQDIAQNPQGVQLSSPFQSTLLSALQLKGEIQLAHFQLTQDEQELAYASTAFRLATQLVDSIRTDLISKKSRQFWQETIHGLYESALEALYQQYRFSQKEKYVEEAFSLMEQSKFALLLLQFRDIDIRKKVNIDPVLLDKEKELVAQIRALTKRKSIDQDTTSLKKRATELARKQVELDRLHYQIEQNTPAYSALKYQERPTQISDVQALIPSDHLLIEFLAGDSAWYVCSLSAQKASFRKIEDRNRLMTSLTEFMGLVLQPIWPDKQEGSLQHMVDQYGNLSNQLYHQLLGPELEKQDISSLLIVPDQALMQFPFDALLLPDGPREFLEWEYLGESYSIQYVHSGSMLKHSKHTGSLNQADHFFAAFAPSFDSQTMDSLDLPGRYSELDWNKWEANHLAKFLGGDSFLGEQASLQALEEVADQYQILHFSTHALANIDTPANSILVLQNGEELRVESILQMQLNADLVVLNACETGKGTYLPGEGMMSIGHAFAYAGCPNSIMSLWLVDDKGAAELMKFFYEGLQKGLPKHVALQQAKQAFLKEAPLNKRLPFFWASLQSWGDPSPLDLPRQTPWWLWGVGLTAVALGGWMLRRRMASQA